MDIQADQITQASVPAAKEKKKSRRRRKLIRRIVFLVLILMLVGLAGYIAYGKLKQEYTVTYQAYTASVGTISNSLSFSGTLQAVSSETHTASSATTVRSVSVKKGSKVAEGDTLMRLANGTIVTAGFDGTVNQLPVSAGDQVSAGDTLIQVVDFDHMKVSIRVDEYDISDVQEGDAVTVTTTATEKTFETVIDDINYVSSSSGSVAYYTATAYVDVDGGVYPGMQVTVTVPQEEASDVVILKEDALSFDGTNQAYVYTQAEDGTMEQTYVKTGVSNGNYVEIRSGLQSGDTVYAVVETTETSVTGSLFASLFGGQQMMGGPGGEPGSGQGGRGGDMGMGGGERPSMPGGNGSSSGGNGGGQR